MFSASNGLFLETDNYTHAMRLEDLIQSGSWREIMYMHDNCPYGQMLHFTRITDMFLYLTSLPFLLFMSVRQAVLFGGFLYNPFIACLTTVALIWAGRSYFSPLARAAGVLFYFFLPFIASLFLAGRPDHHVLLNLFLIIVCGCLLYGAKTQKAAYYKSAGIFCGLSVWISPEGLLAGGFLFAGLSTAWLFRYQSIRRIRQFGQFFFISAAVCLVANPPIQGLFHPDNGRLSVLIVAMLGAAFISFYAEEFIERKKYIASFSGRLFSLSASAALSFLLILLIFGKKAVLSSPISPEIYEIWAAHISELQSGYRGNIFQSDAIIFIYLLTAACIVFFFSGFKIKKLLIEFWFPLFLFSMLIFFSGRFVRPCSVFAAIILPLSAQAFFGNKEIASGIPRAAKPLLIFVLIGLYTAHLFLSHKYQSNTVKRMTNPAEYKAYLSADKGCLLTSTDRGPETAWGTGRPVVGSPYHSNVDGIIDNHSLLYGTDLLQVRDMIKKRGITTIVLEKKTFTDKDSRKASFDRDSRTLGSKLLTGKNLPCFIRQVTEMPPEVAEKYIIFHIDFTECETSKTRFR